MKAVLNILLGILIGLFLVSASIITAGASGQLAGAEIVCGKVHYRLVIWKVER